jgi:hypothetical protein
MKKTDIFDRLDDVIGNHMEEKATDKDLVDIAYEVNRYLLKNPHPHDISNTDEGREEEFFDPEYLVKRCNPKGIRVMHDDEIKEMALEMIYQMSGVRVPEEEQCRCQGNYNYQVAMTYLSKVNGG